MQRFFDGVYPVKGCASLRMTTAAMCHPERSRGVSLLTLCQRSRQGQRFFDFAALRSE